MFMKQKKQVFDEFSLNCFSQAGLKLILFLKQIDFFFPHIRDEK